MYVKSPQTTDIVGVFQGMSLLIPGYGALQVEAEVGKPRVNYLEAITQRVQFDYLHKKQSGVCILLYCTSPGSQQTRKGRRHGTCEVITMRAATYDSSHAAV